MLCYIVLISVINFLKITFRIVLFVGNKFTNLLSRPCKDFFSNRKRGTSGNILIMGQKTGIYPDFNMRMLPAEREYPRKTKFVHVDQSIYTDCKRMPRISTGKPIR